jgi:phage terminase small subunit
MSDLIAARRRQTEGEGDQWMAGNFNSGGRNRKSLAAHAISGTGRKDRGTLLTATSVADVQDPPKGRPPTPIGLIGPALEEWNRMVVRLEAAKTLSTVDDAALYQYCTLFAETEHVIEVRRVNSALIDTLKAAIAKWTRMVNRLDEDDDAAQATALGSQIATAIDRTIMLQKLDMKLTTQLRQGHMAVRQYLVELGMTPAARSRVQPSPDAAPQTSPIDRFTRPRP